MKNSIYDLTCIKDIMNFKKGDICHYKKSLTEEIFVSLKSSKTKVNLPITREELNDYFDSASNYLFMDLYEEKTIKILFFKPIIIKKIKNMFFDFEGFEDKYLRKIQSNIFFLKY